VKNCDFGEVVKAMFQGVAWTFDIILYALGEVEKALSQWVDWI
jgi:hypothetical protein